jgi:hypothetical protein
MKNLEDLQYSVDTILIRRSSMERIAATIVLFLILAIWVQSIRQEAGPTQDLRELSFWERDQLTTTLVSQKVLS